MRRRLLVKLYQILTQVGFKRFNTRSLKVGIEMHLLGDHRLALDHRLGLMALANLTNNATRLITIFRPVHFNTVGLAVGFQLFKQVG